MYIFFLIYVYFQVCVYTRIQAACPDYTISFFLNICDMLSTCKKQFLIFFHFPVMTTSTAPTTAPVAPEIAPEITHGV